MRRQFTGLLGAIALLFPSACGGGTGGGGGGEPAAFQFKTSEDVTLGITITKAGVPLAGVTITIAAPVTAATLGSDAPSTEAWFSGGTDDSGRCTATIALPAHADQVDVIVQHDGSRGVFTDEALRTLWGPLAPSARVTVTTASLTDLVLDLEDA
ncbi:MAG: hypothetical protein HZB39_15955 [Planctomycetes bacterium]|nr:hypothetical protein [Planctomycetota bacterium]